MRYDIYGRFQIEVRRENGAWAAYRSELGKRTRLDDLVIPADMDGSEIAIYLDDVFHEYARLGERVEPMPD